MNKISNTLLVIGLIVLLAGAILTFTAWHEYANYVLIAGAVLVILRGFFRHHDK